jgi:hypothetical protein
MTNSNLEAPGNLIDMDVVSTFRMRDCLNYIQRRNSVSPPVNHYINLRRVDDFIIEGNTLRAYAGAQIAAFIGIGPGSTDSYIGPNVYALEDGYTDPSTGVAISKATTSAAVAIDASATGVRWSPNSIYKYWPAGTPKVVGGSQEL